MFNSGILTSGISIVAVGLGIFFLVWLVQKIISRTSAPFSNINSTTPITLDVASNTAAVLLIAPGGKIMHLNEVARKWFSITATEQPNLENIARYIEPKDDFLSLCATAGEARLTASKSLVEGNSYSFPFNGESATLVTLNKPELGKLSTNDDDHSGDTLKLFAELSQAMSKSLDIEQTVATILESIDVIIPSNFSEITLWDADKKLLVPYQFIAEGGKNRRVENTNLTYGIDEGYSGYLGTIQKPLIIFDSDVSVEIKKSRNQSSHPYKSFIGVPLMIGKNFVGTLELSSHKKNAFKSEDLPVLEILSGQAAVALSNAMTHFDQQRRAVELSGLAELAKISGAIRETKDLFERMVEGLAPTLNVEILGLLLYDDASKILEGQVPFKGMPVQFVELYRTKISPGSQAEKIWDSQKIIQTEKASTDPDLTAYNLAHLAQAAGIRSTLLIPLISNGRSLGYLQAGNKRDGTEFNPDDVKLMSVLASQAAPIIENALLIKASSKRTQRSEAMRRIASLVSSTASLDEILKYSMNELSRLLEAEAAFILLLDEDKGEMSAHLESLFGLTATDIESIQLYSTTTPDYQYAATFSQESQLSNLIHKDVKLPQVYKRMFKSLGQYKSLAVVPMLVREHGLGEIVFLSTKQEAFNRDDVFSIFSATGQLASAVERARLYSQSDEGLQKRVDQLSSLNRFSRELNTTLDIYNLMQRTFSELKRVTNANGGAIILLEADGAETPIQNDSYWGDRAKEELSPLELEVIKTETPIYISDFSKSKHSSSWSSAQSAMVAPIVDHERTVGVIHLYSSKPAAFDDDSISTTQALLSQAAIAIRNARRHQEQVFLNDMLQRRVDSLSKLFENNPLATADSSLDNALESVAQNIQIATSFNKILLYVLDEDIEALKIMSSVGFTENTLEDSKGKTIFWEELNSLLSLEFLHSGAYFIPSERTPPEAPTINLEQGTTPEDTLIAGEDIWQPGDMFIYPIYGNDKSPIGLISVFDPMNGLRPDDTTALELGFVAEEAKIVITGFQNINSLRNQVGDIQDRATQASVMNLAAEEQLSILLHKDLEQTIAIQKLNERGRRIRMGLDIAEISNKQPDRSAVLMALGNQMITKMGLDTVLIAEPSGSGPRLIHSIGSIPSEANPEALLGQRNPLHHSLISGKAVMVSNLDNDSDWKDAPLLKNIASKGFISLPISINGHVDAAILASSNRPMTVFTDEDKQIFELVANQVAIAIENLNILTETRRRLREVNLLLEFSQGLDTLDPTGILEALVSSTLKVMSHAHAGIVMLWNEDTAQLEPHASSGYTNDEVIKKINYRSGEALPGQVFASGTETRIDELNFAKQYNLSSSKLLAYRSATGGRLPVSTMVLPIQTGETILGVIVLDNFNTQGAFSLEDQALVSSLAQQTALTLENARLFQASTQKAGQLLALTNAATNISSSLEFNSLVTSLLDNLSPIIPFETASLWLRTENKLTLRSELGVTDSEERLGLTVSMEESVLLSGMITTGEPIVIANVHEDQRFPAQTQHLYRSWLGMPLIAKGEVIGVIALEKEQDDFYTLDHIQAMKTFAGQAAAALENARLYEDSLSRAKELTQRSQRLAQLNKLSNQISSSLDPDQLLKFAAEELFNAMSCSSVSTIMYEEGGLVLLKNEIPKRSSTVPIVLKNAPIFKRLRQSQGAYSVENILSEPEFSPLKEFFSARNTVSLLAIPLATSTETHGVFLIHSDKNRVFSPDEIELALTISNQAAVGVENALLYEASRKFAEELEQRVSERTEDLAQEHQTTRTLLRISTELSSSLDLDQVLIRSLELINKTTDANQSSILLTKPGQVDLIYKASVGSQEASPNGDQKSTIKIDEGLAGWVIENQEPLMVPSLLADPRWKSSDTNDFANHKSAIAAPLIVGEEVLGVLLLYSDTENHFNKNQVDMIQAAANQFAVGINNSELYLLIRDQAESLGSMLRTQQVDSSRSTAMLEGVADGVFVTDEQGLITLFNTAAQNILGLQSDQIIGKTTDEFLGIFGDSAQKWIKTIHAWSENSPTKSDGQVYSEDILLEDGQIVSIRLAPVSSRKEFLGTVSIIRDVTHEVEVDRLKSEFVATVSHELRTPMTPIKGYIDLLLMGSAGELNDQQKEFIGVISTNINRLSGLVNDLLDISKIESGLEILTFERVHLQNTIKEVVEEIRSRADEEGKAIDITFKMQPDVPDVSANPDRIRQIIYNLIDNAYHYTSENGNVEVRLLLNKDHMVQVDVTDNGIGIFPEDQDRVFERFYRGENQMVMAIAGTGLGLHIVKELIEMHKGEIWLESDGIPGEGSSFSITIPIYENVQEKNLDDSLVKE